MLTKTTITAVRTLLHIGLQPAGESLSIRRIAEQLGESPTYLAKVTRHLVKAGILRARYGVTGGVTLNVPAESITLLAVVEACQGAILPDFCRKTGTLDGVCVFHLAAAELHESIVRSLSRWTLAQLLERPGPTGPGCASIPCLMRRHAEVPSTASRRPGRRRG